MECTANGQNCLFPFNFKGVTYNSCTKASKLLHKKDNSETESPWCALEVNQYGQVIVGKWGDCDPNCAIVHNGK